MGVSACVVVCQWVCARVCVCVYLCWCVGVHVRCVMPHSYIIKKVTALICHSASGQGLNRGVYLWSVHEACDFPFWLEPVQTGQLYPVYPKAIISQGNTAGNIASFHGGNYSSVSTSLSDDVSINTPINLKTGLGTSTAKPVHTSIQSPAMFLQL